MMCVSTEQDAVLLQGDQYDGDVLNEILTQTDSFLYHVSLPTGDYI